MNKTKRVCKQKLGTWELWTHTLQFTKEKKKNSREKSKVFGLYTTVNNVTGNNI